MQILTNSLSYFKANLFIASLNHSQGYAGIGTLKKTCKLSKIFRFCKAETLSSRRT